MKDTGIVRAIDELGRIVIPKELRRTLGVEPRDRLQIYVDGQRVVMKKHCTSCSICGNQNAEEQLEIDGKLICRDCAKKISQILCSNRSAG